jgi:hypothetical protein
MLGIDLAGGAIIFLLFLVGYTIAVAYSTYGRRGNAITHQPYGKVYGGAPGAMSEDSRPTGRDRGVASWTRGTH